MLWLELQAWQAGLDSNTYDFLLVSQRMEVNDGRASWRVHLLGLLLHAKTHILSQPKSENKMKTM